MTATMMSMQGIAVPASSVNPDAFFEATRRLTFQQKSLTFAGLGGTDNIPILQTGIISALAVRVSGTVVVTLGGGTCATTAAWPYGLVKAAKFTANGQSNLINLSGPAIKARMIMGRGDLNDRGVSRNVGGAAPGTVVTQGTLSQAAEDWGTSGANKLGNNTTANVGAPTTYTYDLFFEIPVAADPVSLTGAVFAQTASTDLNLSIDWANTADLFTLTGAATAVVSASVVVSGIAYTIPQGADGGIVIPDLSWFHGLTQNRFNGPSNGTNEPRFVGQGAGRRLLRFFFRTMNGAAPVPLIPNATNYGQLGWRFGGNDTPELMTDGQQVRYIQERTYGVDIGAVWGWTGFDFASEFAARDTLDEGTATELRPVIEIPAAVSLTSPFFEVVQETIFTGATGA